MTSFGALSGGVGAELSGGDFWRGAGTGATISLLNHLADHTEGSLAEKKAFKQKHSLDGMNLSDMKKITDGAGYASGVAGATQLGMIQYRSSLSLSSKIGTFSKFFTTYKGLGVGSKFLGNTAAYIGGPLSVGLDYRAYNNDEIGIRRLTYRTTGTVSSIATGAMIGARYGKAWGAVAGAFVGGVVTFGEMLYDAGSYLSNEINSQVYNFKQGLRNGWYPGR